MRETERPREKEIKQNGDRGKCEESSTRERGRWATRRVDKRFEEGGREKRVKIEGR